MPVLSAADDDWQHVTDPFDFTTFGDSDSDDLLTPKSKKTRVPSANPAKAGTSYAYRTLKAFPALGDAVQAKGSASVTSDETKALLGRSITVQEVGHAVQSKESPPMTSEESNALSNVNPAYPNPWTYTVGTDTEGTKRRKSSAIPRVAPASTKAVAEKDPVPETSKDGNTPSKTGSFVDWWKMNRPVASPPPRLTVTQPKANCYDMLTKRTPVSAALVALAAAQPKALSIGVVGDTGSVTMNLWDNVSVNKYRDMNRNTIRQIQKLHIWLNTTEKVGLDFQNEFLAYENSPLRHADIREVTLQLGIKNDYLYPILCRVVHGSFPLRRVNVQWKPSFEGNESSAKIAEFMKMELGNLEKAKKLEQGLYWEYSLVGGMQSWKVKNHF